jgi:Bacterial membrane protein YfhO
VRPMAERVMSRQAKEAWKHIRQAVFNRMGVEFLVSDRVELDPAWPVAAKGTWNDSRFVIQRNASAMPRAYVVPRAMVLPDHPGVVLSAFAGLDPRDSVVMTSDPLAGTASGPRQSFTAAEWTSVDPDRPALVVTTRAPGLLVVADSWMPGWTATVDGRPAPVLRGNYAQRVVPLPEPGRHVITMRYHPPGILFGCVVSLTSALAWVIVVARRVVAQLRARPVACPPSRRRHLRRSGTLAASGTSPPEPHRSARPDRW